MVHEEKSTKNNLQNSFTATSQYWSGIYKQAQMCLQNDPKCFQRSATKLKKSYFSKFSTASLMRSVKRNRKLAIATTLLLWRKRFEFCGEKTFHNIKYLRCVRYCLTVLSLILLYHGHLSWVRLPSKHAHHSSPTYWNKCVA